MYPGSLLQLAGTVLRLCRQAEPGNSSLLGAVVGLAAVHILGAAALVFIGGLLGAIRSWFPDYDLSWLLYIALLVVCVVVRVRLMLAAYAGIRFTLPLIGERLAVLFDKR